MLGFANRLDWFTGSPMGFVDELLTLSTNHGFPVYLGWAEAYRGRSLAALGRAGDGLALLTQALSECVPPKRSSIRRCC